MEIKIKKLSGHDKEAKVGKITVKENQEVSVGEVLVNLESGKGNIAFKAECAGTITSIHIEEGANVKIGETAFIMEASEGGSKDNVTPIKSGGYSFGLTKQRNEKIDCDIAIIGGGPGGYVAAIRAAQLGANVVVVEKERFGGTCLNHGCIPTKALVKSAHVFDDINNSENYGIEIENATANIEKIINRKNDIVDTLVGGIEYLMDEYNIKVINAEGVIKDGVLVAETKMVKSEINAKNTIIATGSSAFKLNIPGADLKRVLTSKEILNIKEIPKKLTIIGGGIIGMEFAFIFNSLGSEVTVIEYLDDIINILDEDVLAVVKEKCEAVGINLHTSSRAEEIIRSDERTMITKFTKDEESKYVVGDYVLMAVGRRPNIAMDQMKDLGIEIDDKYRGIKVDETLKTTNDNYYAIGDATNIIQLAHVASHQGIVAVENIMGIKSTMKYDVVPSGIFISPEVGTVGLSEKEASAKGIDYKVGMFPFAANGKALTNGDSEGFVKVITNQSNEIIGASIIGHGATDMIATFTPMIENKTTAEDLTHTIFAHPTTAESIHEAVLDIKGESVHNVSSNNIKNSEATA
jgi:dihydrolipoamide dehydrogenase